MLSKDEVKARIDLVQLIQDSGVELHKNGQEWVGRCPFHNDGKASLSVNPDKRVWNCFGCGAAGDCYDWVQQLRKVPFKEALAQLREQCGDVDATRTTCWEIPDADGNLIAKHYRFERPDGSKTYSWNGKDGLGGMRVESLPLYGIRHLFDMGSAAVTSIIICEGEKCADALIKVGYAALGTVTGASSCPSEEAFHPLIGFEARTYLWPDHDAVGRSHMDNVAGHLKALGIQPYVVNWAEAPAHGDAHDFLQQGLDVQILLDAAVPWNPTADTVARNNSHVSNDRTLQAPSTKERYKSVTDSCCNGIPPDSVTVLPDETQYERVLEWVKNTSGWWSSGELDAELGIKDPQQKNYRRLIIHRLKEQGVVEGHPRINKQYRHINRRVTSLAFKTASNAGILPLQWPLGMEKFVNLYPGNLVVVAGSPNAGKTALLLDFMRRNMDRFPIKYFCSEMGEVELRARLEKFPDMPIDGWKFDALERAADFEDVVVPDCINVVDFLELSDELYRVNTHLTAMSHKIGTGLLVCALQKKEGAKFGRGQEFGLEKPKLYMSMDKGKLTIVKGKSWVSPTVDPNGLSVTFKIVGGCQFEVSQTWHWPKV